MAKQRPTGGSKALGRWLREQRHARGMTQQQLADQIGEYRQNVAAVEGGSHRWASPALLLALSEALGVPFSHVIARFFGLPLPTEPGQNLAEYYRHVGLLHWAQDRCRDMHDAALELVQSEGLTQREHGIALRICAVVEDLGTALAVEWHHGGSRRTGNR